MHPPAAADRRPGPAPAQTKEQTSMRSANKALFVLMLAAVVGLWGCTQNRGGNSSARVRDLEARNTKLEEDYRVAVTDAAQVRKKLASAEEQVALAAQQAKELQTVAAERDQLRKQLTTTTTEKTALHAQMVQFGRELQALAGKLDAAATGAAPPAETSASSATVGPSS
jgi:septal ring factor EnvC (AmiA/AmiB activator)